MERSHSPEKTWSTSVQVPVVGPQAGTGSLALGWEDRRPCYKVLTVDVAEICSPVLCRAALGARCGGAAWPLLAAGSRRWEDSDKLEEEL